MKYCWLLFLLLLTSCLSEKDREKQLAKTHCSSCHMFPEPSRLGKKIWEESVFPQMSFRMGIDMTNLMRISSEDIPVVTRSLPGKPIVSQEEFDAIQRYFISEAPDSLTTTSFSSGELTQFEPQALRLPGSVGLPVLTLLAADTLTNSIWISNRKSDLLTYSFDLKRRDSIKLSSPVSWMSFKEGNTLASAMGIMDPNDQSRGEILNLSNHNVTTVLDSLKLPVHFERADLNGDGSDDLVVCAFGNYTGELVVMESSTGWVKHTISSLPGARRVIVRDFNNDGRPDILALFSQGDEQISLFTNAGNFNFRINTLLRFEPEMGSSYFDVADFNGDGSWDILYTNGDNSDYSAVLKPYHGIHTYLNDGKNHFTESWFHLMHGCSKAIAHDFDSDGDLDLAAISFFPDFDKSPEQGFIYFRRDKDQYVPQATSLGSKGRWLLMESVDLDSDNDLDLMLGALDFGVGVNRKLFQQWAVDPVDILVLKNNQTK